MNVKFCLSYEIKITFNSHFWRKMLCKQRCYGHHNIFRKSVNGTTCGWFINFIAWRYFTPRRNVI